MVSTCVKGTVLLTLPILYGVECKYYSARPETVDFELDGCKGIYAIGDGAGFTRSLSQASAHGLYIADKFTKD